MLTAAEIMNREVICVKEEVSITELARIFLKEKISGVPVVDDDDKLCGIVCESDLIEQQKNLHLPTVVTILDAVIFLESTKHMEQEMKKMAGTKAGDIMSFPVITVKEETPLNEIASIMSDKQKHLLPVMKDDEIVGIIGKADIVRAIAGDLG